MTDVRMATKKIRVLLADDHPITRRGIRAVLEEAPDIKVIGEAQNGIEAKELIAQFYPDVLLLDLVMPGPKPADIERWMRTNYPKTKTLILTAHDRGIFLSETLEAGAAGFLTKDKDTSTLITAIRQAMRGETLYTQEQLERVRCWQAEVRARWECLTEREQEVLRLVAAGLRNAAIAKALCITKKLQ